MRKAIVLITLLGGGLAGSATQSAHDSCGVSSRYPCTPTFCSVFRRGRCIPDYGNPIGQDLRLTIESTSATDTTTGHSNDQSRELNSIRELFAALRECWMPPPAEHARHGMQMSVRLSFR